jgi:hypothetical protein
MEDTKRCVNPGGEHPGPFPIGSKEWAERWRLEVQSIWAHITHEPETLARYWELGRRHEVWKLLSRPDGTPHTSYDEFCRGKYPWGLSRKQTTEADVERWIALVRGEKPVERTLGWNDYVVMREKLRRLIAQTADPLDTMTCELHAFDVLEWAQRLYAHARKMRLGRIEAEAADRWPPYSLFSNAGAKWFDDFLLELNGQLPAEQASGTE